MFEQHTKQAILERMLAAVPPELDRRPGSVVHDMLSPAAIELAQLYIRLGQTLDWGFAGPQQPGPYLDLRAAEMGLARKPGTKSSGELLFAGAAGTRIREGTIASLPDGTVSFATREAATIGEGKQVLVRAVSSEPGAAGNVQPGSISRVLGDLAGIVAVSNPKAFAGGADEESDASLLQRYYDRVRTPATSGNAGHYRQWALESEGIGDVKVFEVWQGGGTVKLSLLGPDGTPAKPDKVDLARAAIEARRPIGAKVTVAPAKGIEIDVAAQLRFVPGVELEPIVVEFRRRLAAYLAGLAFKKDRVPFNRIAGILIGIDEVDDYVSLAMNGGSADIALEADMVPVAGKVEIEYDV
ncbi:baseplate J/gp47 family protein [Paenibacillus pasadenensis]|uniref:baseplate J/gp47 family protein n=1 Tax=Paenibacillus pasadenensis TaxID=217090 RepID=UPI000423AF80|nr:baseplate J/gp47 family protein [Paenibacillus pasadenensis]